jgi:hypothetical protein
MRKLLTILSSIGLISVLNTSAFGQGCSMCRAALEQSPEGRLVATSFAHGILMMLVLPYVLLGAFAIVLYRAYRKKSKQRSQQNPSFQT